MALTLPSSNGNSLFFNLNINSANDNGQIINSFNGGLTKTTATLTPTRLKNIEEQFLGQSSSEYSLLPPKPFLHDHMAGFVPPTVNVMNIKLNASRAALSSASLNNNNFELNHYNTDLQFEQQSATTSQNSKSIDYYSSNSNSNDSNSLQIRFSDDYSNNSETNSNSTASVCGNNFNGNVANSYTFTNFLSNSNNSLTGIGGGSKKMKNNSSRTTRSKSMAKSGGANVAISASKSSARSSHQKKSTGGGRKPNSAQNLTPDEEMKRQKRRERNKIAAARCRKKRVDQTNSLLIETKELQKKQDALIKEINAKLEEFQNHKNILESHKNVCRNMKIRESLTELFSQIDLIAIQTAMERVPDEDIDNDLNASCYASSSQDEFSQQSSPPKRKRPNVLQFAPMVTVSNGNPQQQTFTNSNNSIIKMEPSESSSMIITTNNNTITTSTATLTTPSNGLFGDLGLDLTGLTPINPTITSDDLTPSTMNAFLKSLQSPMDDGEKKRLLLM